MDTAITKKVKAEIEKIFEKVNNKEGLNSFVLVNSIITE